MVTVTDFVKRENSEGKEFFALVLKGDVEMVMSKETGRFYATTKSCTVNSTLDEADCKAVIGTKMPGAIIRTEVDPYEITDKETGEVVTRNHRWVYVKEAEKMDESIHTGEVIGKPAEEVGL